MEDSAGQWTWACTDPRSKAQVISKSRKSVCNTVKSLLPAEAMSSKDFASRTFGPEH